MATNAQKKLIGKEALLDILAARVFAYSFLSRVFLDEPTKEFIALLIEDDLLDSFPGVENHPILKEGHESVVFTLRDPDILSDESVVDLVAEFNRIFLGSGKGTAVSPYESVHRSPDRLVFQKETMDVRAAYTKHSLQVEHFQREPDDHIAFELLFMQKLSENILADARANRFHKARRLLRDQLAFLDDHLLKWAPEMAEKMAEKTKAGFYHGAAQMLGGYLKTDRDVLEGLLDDCSERILRHKEKSRIKAV